MRTRRHAPAGQVLRVRASQARWNVSLRKFASLFADSLSTREFVGLGPADLAPKYSTLQENLAKVQPETWGRILEALVTSDEAREIETGEKVRVDATVTESNIRPPSDSSLLWDCVRVLTRLMNQGRAGLGLDFEDHSKKAKKLQSRIFFARKAAQRAPAYQELLDVSRAVDEQVVAVLAKLRTFEPRTVEDLATRKVLVAEIERVRALFVRIVDQTTRRVINGEKVPAQEKVLSIFEPHTDLIAKKGSRPEFGHKVTFTAGPSGQWAATHPEIHGPAPREPRRRPIPAGN